MAVLQSGKEAVVAGRARAQRRRPRFRTRVDARARAAVRRRSALHALLRALRTVVGRNVRHVEHAVVARVARARGSRAEVPEAVIAHVRRDVLALKTNAI